MSDTEQNRFSARASRYARVGANVGGVAARIAGGFLVGRSSDGDRRNAAALTAALGGLKGPLMKVAQLIATIPEAVPAEYAEELRKLQSEAPPMGWAFVKRRMTAELGADWVNRFGSFEKEPAAAASLGQVHRATTLDGRRLACKLQYPDMESAVEADLRQLDLLFSIHRRMSNVIDTREIKQEIAARIREELDYTREAKHARLYRSIFPSDDLVRVPKVEDSLSTRRLLSLEWLDGEKMLAFKGESEEVRNRLAKAMFRAWWHPFAQVGIIHGDPHLGNYTVFRDDGGEPSGINLLDYGCIRIWGFKNLKNDQIDVLSLWARFIFGPLLDDRVRTIADGVSPGEYGRREAFQVHQALKEKGPVTIPREFVFMDRAAIGLGGVFLHLDARLNFHRLFNAEIEAFAVAQVAARQQAKLTQFGLP